MKHDSREHMDSSDDFSVLSNLPNIYQRLMLHMQVIWSNNVYHISLWRNWCISNDILNTDNLDKEQYVSICKLYNLNRAEERQHLKNEVCIKYKTADWYINIIMVVTILKRFITKLIIFLTILIMFIAILTTFIAIL